MLKPRDVENIFVSDPSSQNPKLSRLEDKHESFLSDRADGCEMSLDLTCYRGIGQFGRASEGLTGLALIAPGVAYSWA